MTTSSPARPRRRTAVATLAAAAGAVLLLGLTACAPAADSGAELKTDDYETSVVDWRQKFDDCMLDAGFDLNQENADGSPTNTIDTSQFDMAEFDKAYAACTEKVGEPPVDESLPTEEELFDSQLAFATCMREFGYDYPDPVKGNGGMTPALGPEVNPDDIDACSAKAEQAGAE
ncbi:hypothetical protein [Microterricola gilva]|nr:hypothetical protein [Microterricola gilva]